MGRTLEQSKIAKRYVYSLFSELKTTKESNQVAKDLHDIGQMLNLSEDLQLFIKSPLLSEAQHIKGIEKLAGKAKFSLAVSNLLRLLAENRRLPILPHIVWEADKYMTKRSGVVPVMIASARKLPPTEQNKIKSEIKKSLKQDVTIQCYVDETLIGGLIIQVESTLIDGSLKTKLDKLERDLTSARAA